MRSNLRWNSERRPPGERHGNVDPLRSGENALELGTSESMTLKRDCGLSSSLVPWHQRSGSLASPGAVCM